MSRLGKKPIAVPSSTKVNLDPKRCHIAVEGPKGKLEYTYRPEVTVTWDEDEKQIVCSIPEDQQEVRQMRAYWGTVRSLIQGMITGCSTGFEKKLEIVGVGWNAQDKGKTLQLNIGFCHPVEIDMPKGVEVETPNPTQIVLRGPDKQAVGQIAAVIRGVRPPEPYKGKGIRYEGEYVRRKVGKSFGS